MFVEQAIPTTNPTSPFPEMTFHLQYAKQTALLDAYASVMALAAHGAILLGSCFQSGPAVQQSEYVWVRTTLILSTLVLYYSFGEQVYTHTIGLNSVWQRLFFATGIVFNMRPGSCSYCGLLWNHRLLFVHLALLVRRVPAAWYWSGGVISWLAAAAVDAADPGAANIKSITSLYSILQNKLLHAPGQFVRSTLMTASSSMFGVDVVLPGVVLTWLEWRAYDRWLKQQQTGLQSTLTLQMQRQQSSAAASSSSRAQEAADLGRRSRAAQYENAQLATWQRRSNSSSSTLNGGLAEGFGAMDHSAYAASDLSIGVREVIFGFQDFTVESAYNTYKSAALQGQDLLSMVVFVAIFVGCTAKLMLLVWGGRVGIVAVLVAALRMLFTLMLAMLHTIVWASSWHRQLAALQQKRGALVWGFVLLGQIFALACITHGGVLATAAKSVVQEYFASPLLLIAFRHVIQPVLFCVGIAPATVLYLVFRALAFDGFLGRPQLNSLGPNETAVLYVVVHLVVAIQAEVRLRRRFVNSITPRTP